MALKENSTNRNFWTNSCKLKEAIHRLIVAKQWPKAKISTSRKLVAEMKAADKSKLLEGSGSLQLIDEQNELN